MPARSRASRSAENPTDAGATAAAGGAFAATGCARTVTSPASKQTAKHETTKAGVKTRARYE